MNRSRKMAQSAKWLWRSGGGKGDHPPGGKRSRWGWGPRSRMAHTLLWGSDRGGSGRTTQGWLQKARSISTPGTQVPRMAKESLCTEHGGELAKAPTRPAGNQAGTRQQQGSQCGPGMLLLLGPGDGGRGGAPVRTLWTSRQPTGMETGNKFKLILRKIVCLVHLSVNFYLKALLAP